MKYLSISACMFALAFGMLAAPVRAQKQADRPAEGTAPAPDTDKTEKAQPGKPDSGEKTRERRASKSVDKPAEDKTDKNAPTIRLLELSGQYVDLVQPLGLDPTSLLMGGDSLKQKSFFKLCDYLESVSKEEKVSHIVLDLSDAAWI